MRSTLLKPFLSYPTPNAWSFALNTESTYYWEREQWSSPINTLVSKVPKVGGQLVSVDEGVRDWADDPDSSPHG